MPRSKLRSLELCAGGGGQALGLEEAGFHHEGLIDIDEHCCSTLSFNRPKWNVSQSRLEDIKGGYFGDIDLLSGGLPCPPFSVAGKQMGAMDERNCFPHALRLIKEIRPKIIMFENVRGLLLHRFQDYRNYIEKTLRRMDYFIEWKIINASEFGVPQMRQRAICIAVRKNIQCSFSWPESTHSKNTIPVVGDVLFDLMSSNGWKEVKKWQKNANDIAPTIVGGSKKHGGPDLGPTRTKKAWERLGVDGRGISNDAPDENFVGMPKLTLRMVARLQGFPDEWQFIGKKTAAYRQIGNALPPRIAKVIGLKIFECLTGESVRPLEVTIRN